MSECRAQYRPGSRVFCCNVPTLQSLLVIVPRPPFTLVSVIIPLHLLPSHRLTHPPTYCFKRTRCPIIERQKIDGCQIHDDVSEICLSLWAGYKAILETSPCPRGTITMCHLILPSLPPKTIPPSPTHRLTPYNKTPLSPPPPTFASIPLCWSSLCRNILQAHSLTETACDVCHSSHSLPAPILHRAALLKRKPYSRSNLAIIHRYSCLQLLCGGSPRHE